MFGFKRNDFETVKNYYEKIIHFERMLEQLYWDQETNLPIMGAEMRAKIIGELVSEIHQKLIDADFQKAFNDLDPAKLKGLEAADYARMKSQIDRAIKIPQKLQVAIEEGKATAFAEFSLARETHNTRPYLLKLKELIALKQEEGQLLKTRLQTTYDVLLSQYEPGASTNYISALFSTLRPIIVELREKIQEKNKTAPLIRMLHEDVQWKMMQNIVPTMGLASDFTRMDLTKTPFSAGQYNDIRLGLRIDTENPLKTITALMHIIGIASYTHHLSPELMYRASGRVASSGCHQAMGYFFHIHIGQSLEFMKYLKSVVAPHNQTWESTTPEDLYMAVNNITPNPIRESSDELHQLLHIFMRFDLERSLMSGELTVDDLEAEWKKQVKANMGLEIARPINSFLQESHWASGNFGIFPSYAIGRVYAAAIYEEMESKIGEIGKKVASGDNSLWVKYLSENFMSFGSEFSGEDLIKKLTRYPPNTSALASFLTKKYTQLYDL